MKFDGYFGEKLIAKITLRVSLESRFPVLHIIVIGCAYHSQSVQIGLLKQKQTGKERKWLHVCDAGTRDEPLRTSAWEAKP